MAIEFRDGTFFLRFYYAEITTTTRGGNFMGAIFRAPEDNCWHFKYRFRWYVDNDMTSNSKDVRSWYEIKADEPDSPVDALIETVCRMLGIMCPDGYDEILLDTDRVEEITAKLRDKPWAHPGVTAPHLPVGEA